MHLSTNEICLGLTKGLFALLQAQQQQHERDLALLKLKAEQEALESQRQLEEARQKAAQVMWPFRHVKIMNEYKIKLRSTLLRQLK